ncbi:MAG: YidC/Oxa1 family membrane protein insertase [Paracoccaceae bacterium]|jgi:YidC/Oxa1 family membrane protein insertase
MDDQNKNLLLATGLSFLVIVGWFLLFPPEPTRPVLEAPVQTLQAQAPVAATASTLAPVLTVATSARIAIETPELQGTVSTLGGRIDDLSLRNYNVSLDDGSDIVQLFRPVGQESAFYTFFGWAPAGAWAASDLPNADTEWAIKYGRVLTPQSPITLNWDNGKGLTFEREISVDEKFMFFVTDRVVNNTSAPVSLAHYGIIARHGMPEGLQNFFILHEGAVGRADGVLTETDYKDITKLTIDAREGFPAETTLAQTDGWIGFTDHYWMATLIPNQGTPFTSVVKYVPSADIYQAETRQPLLTVAPGRIGESSARLFAGAKEWEAIRNYEKSGVSGFLKSIDWGWFEFLTKPIFFVLHWLNALIGNMGLAIIALTIVLKALVLPLAYKSYVSMARMKELQPEVEALKARSGEDKQKMQREMMALYKEKKVNPAAGCLPVLIQIPIFFSLYKVIFVTLELRHKPFFGWIKDLSAPDSSTIYNLFGIFPWGGAEAGTMMATIFIGILPILLGISMWLQQKLNPAPADPTQAMIFAWMPWVFMFMLGSFASGLVIYWITNNTITFMQQYAIMRGHGHKPAIFDNIKKSFRKKPLAEVGAKKPANQSRAPKKK